MQEYTIQLFHKTKDDYKLRFFSGNSYNDERSVNLAQVEERCS